MNAGWLGIEVPCHIAFTMYSSIITIDKESSIRKNGLIFLTVICGKAPVSIRTQQNSRLNKIHNHLLGWSNENIGT